MAEFLGALGGLASGVSNFVTPLIQQKMAQDNLSWLSSSVGLTPGEFVLAQGNNPSTVQYQGAGSFTTHKLYGPEANTINMARFPGATRPLK